MGISDDIKPKRTYRPVKDENPIEIDEDDDVIDHEEEIPSRNTENSAQRDDLENEFFKGSHKATVKQKGEEHEPRKHRSRLGRVVLVLMLLAFLGIVAYQNLDGIKSVVKKIIFKENDTTQNTDNTQSDNNFYVGETATGSTAGASSQESSATGSTAPAAPEVNKGAISIELLNGNGIKNSADAIKARLVAAGYKVAKVANARNFNYTTTIIYFKAGKEAEANLLKEELKTRELSTQNSDSIVGSYDLVIVIGAK